MHRHAAIHTRGRRVLLQLMGSRLADSDTFSVVLGAAARTYSSESPRPEAEVGSSGHP